MRDLLLFPILALIGISTFVMLFQASSHEIPTFVYLLFVIIFAGGVIASAIFGDEALAFWSVLIFSLTIRLMFYVSTQFSVFSFGDPFEQFGVLQAFAQTSHASVLRSFVTFANVSPLLPIASQYSQWPGLQILALSFARVTGLPLLQSSILITLIFYVGWFIVSYVLIKMILQKVSTPLPNVPAICMALMTSFPTSEIVPDFKYDFMATIMLLVSILLVVQFFGRQDSKASKAMIVLAAAIVVTHNITSVVWLTLLGLIVILTLIGSYSSRGLARVFEYLNLPKNKNSTMPYVLVFVAVVSFSWWSYYSVFIFDYLRASLPKTILSSSFQAFSFSRQSPTSLSFLVSSTPKWLLEILTVRNSLLLGLLALGILIIFVRPAFLKNPVANALILSVALIVAVTEFVGGLSFGDRAFLLFAPLIATIVLIPVMLLATRTVSLAKVTGAALVFVFMFSVSIAFWGASFAPVALYQKGASVPSASGRPLGWPAVSSYLSYSNRPICIVTNEIYVTSLAVPFDEWNITNVIGNAGFGSGCLAILYSGIDFNQYYNVTTFGFTEPIHRTNLPALRGFSFPAFYNRLENHTDLIFTTGNTTIYYGS